MPAAPPRVVQFTIDLPPGQRIVQGGTSPRYSPSGHIVYARAGSLYAVPFDTARLEATGTPARVGSPVPYFHAHGARLTVYSVRVSIGRERMVFSLAERTSNIWMAQWKGGW